MNPGSQPIPLNGQPAASALSLDDIYFTLFRHKWLILAFVCLGFLGVGAVRLLRPPPYVSKAKLMVLYVNDIKPGNTASNQDEQFMPIDPGGEAVLNSEIEIIKSIDVAERVVDQVGAPKILAKLGGGADRNAAISVVASGIDVEVPPRTTILSVSFKHRDPDLVQPLLRVLLSIYQDRHVEVREKVQVRKEKYTKDLDTLNADISKIDQELKQLKAQGQVMIYDDVMTEYQNRISKARDDLFAAQRDLDERRLLLGSQAPAAPETGHTNTAEVSLPAALTASYEEICADLEANNRRDRELIQEGLLEAHPLRLRVQERIQLLQKQKANLEAKNPALKQYAQASRSGGTNSPSAGPATADDLKALTARVEACQKSLTNILAEATALREMGPRLQDLERKRDEDQREHDSIVSALSSMMADAHAAGPLINMSEVQSPTPPRKDFKKFYKLVAAVFGGCAGMGLVLAFGFDMIIDRTIRRSRDIERHLHLPVFLAIPDTTWTSGIRWPWFSSRKRALAKSDGQTPDNGAAQPDLAVVRWSPEEQLTTYTEGLRERLLTYFEVHNLNLKKPKLVAVTGCATGSGVTTLASGLAAELSKTGDGNVLYVDMSGGHGSAHPFYKGKPSLGLAEALEPKGKADARVEEKLFLARLTDGGKNTTEPIPSNRFNQLVPKLKASDYDYIIFDMPQVSPTSSTPRLAAHMDIVLLVLESEKTGQQSAARAVALMREARANVAAVLNKCRPHVPERLSQDL
jgi:uncharacterized protein involved in exopolysaccharide biosynthesis/Mrp family chromosome partitioning ATPase